MSDDNTCGKMSRASIDLSAKLRQIDDLPLPPVAAMADTTAYLRPYYDAYLARAASGPRRVLLVGMNPSPHGMAQCGVPFGDVDTARRILDGVDLPRPDIDQIQSSKRGPPLLEIAGLAYHRREESGTRLWSAIEQVCGGLDAALSRVCVLNFCPLVLLDKKGSNVTPAKWPSGDPAVRTMIEACREHLRTAVHLLRPSHMIAVGKWAEARCRETLEHLTVDQVAGIGPPVPRLWYMLHPSPLAGSAQQFMSHAIPILTQTCGVGL